MKCQLCKKEINNSHMLTKVSCDTDTSSLYAITGELCPYCGEPKQEEER